MEMKRTHADNEKDDRKCDDPPVAAPENVGTVDLVQH